MKILYCIQSTYNSGGMERILSIKANYLADRFKHDVYIVTTDQCGKRHFYEFSPNIKFIDLNIGYTDTACLGVIKKILTRLKQSQIHKSRLFEVLQSIKPDITISMFGREADFLWKSKDGSKKVLEFHFSRYVRIKRQQPILWKIVSLFNTYKDNLIARKYDKFVVLTKEDMTYWKKCANIINIPNPSMQYLDKYSSCENKRIIAVGRLCYQKGFDLLIKVWHTIQREAPDWSLHIFGSGDLENTLKEQILKLNIKSAFIHKPTPNITDEYLSSSIFVLSSRYEGFPMVLLEAMSCGLPVVSFACKCGPKDIIRNDYNGYIVEEGNIHDFADKLLYLIQNDSQRKTLGKKAIESIRPYNLDNVMEHWDILFRSLLSMKG